MLVFILVGKVVLLEKARDFSQESPSKTEEIYIYSLLRIAVFTLEN